MEGMRLANMDRIWPKLSEAKEVKAFREDPKLKPYLNSSCWITAPDPLFKAHLKGLAYRMPTMWDARVRSDAELLDAWFGTAKAQGVKIFDVEIERSTLRAIDIRDLVEPPDLCIIIMGVKNLPNREAPGSLAEAISYRAHVSKPTWVVDQPDRPLDGTHRYFSEEVERILRRWPRLTLTPKGILVSNVASQPRNPNPVSESALENITETVEDFEEEDDTPKQHTNSLLADLEAKESKDQWKRKKPTRRKR